MYDKYDKIEDRFFIGMLLGYTTVIMFAILGAVARGTYLSDVFLIVAFVGLVVTVICMIGILVTALVETFK